LDIADTVEPRSDQQNFDDYIAGARTVTVDHVKVVGGDQPVELHLLEYPGRPYKPGKSMRRVLIKCWGPDSIVYVGRRITLYGDPKVKFGGQEVGGIRIAALSHIDEPKEIHLTVTRGKRAPFVVQPILEGTGEHLAALSSAESLDELQAAWKVAQAAGVAKLPELIAAKDARKAALSETPAGETPGEREPGTGAAKSASTSPLPVDDVYPSEAEWAEMNGAEK